MESTDRPYVDPTIEPGDAGTEPWADDRDSEAGDEEKPRTPATPSSPAEQGPAVDGSPADEFIADEDVVSARNEDPA
jgi:hypothetical protein